MSSLPYLPILDPVLIHHHKLFTPLHAPSLVYHHELLLCMHPSQFVWRTLTPVKFIALLSPHLYMLNYSLGENTSLLTANPTFL